MNGSHTTKEPQVNVKLYQTHAGVYTVCDRKTDEILGRVTKEHHGFSDDGWVAESYTDGTFTELPYATDTRQEAIDQILTSKENS